MSWKSRTALGFMVAFGVSVIPTAALSYTCFNPAICKAICGSETCVEASQPTYKPLKRFSDSEMERELRAAPRESAVADVLRAVMSSDQERAEGYTCWNPAICIAVCGKKTC